MGDGDAGNTGDFDGVGVGVGGVILGVVVKLGVGVGVKVVVGVTEGMVPKTIISEPDKNLYTL